MDFFEFGFCDFRDCRDVEVVVCRVVGDMPGSVEYCTNDFGLETLDALDVGLNLSAIRPCRLEDGLYIFILLLMDRFDEPLISRLRSITLPSDPLR